MSEIENQVYCVEYSEYSNKNGMFPFHVGPLDSAIKKNLRDFWHNSRGDNKWQIVYIGTVDKCSDVLDGLNTERIRRQQAALGEGE